MTDDERRELAEKLACEAGRLMGYWAWRGTHDAVDFRRRKDEMGRFMGHLLAISLYGDLPDDELILQMRRLEAEGHVMADNTMKPVASVSPIRKPPDN